MSKVKPTTKEQLVYYLLQHISLGTYDKRFLTNLQSTKTEKIITSNQAELLDKIVMRYARQLRKQEIDATEMVNLKWNMNPIDSLPEYTDAFCTIKDNIVEVRSPYNKEFIKEIKGTPIHLTWDKETKIWSGPLCEMTLKHFIDCLDKHYQVVRYCKKTIEIINNLAEYESAKCWNPTYKKVNGNYLIASINPHVYEAVSNLTLDNSPATLARLIASGITIDQEVIEDAVYSLGGTTANYKLIDQVVSERAVFHIGDLNELMLYLTSVGSDYVVVYEAYKNISASKHIEELRSLLEANNFKFSLLSRKTEFDVNLKEYEFPVIVNTSLWGISNTIPKYRACKTVYLGNNKPIDIK